MNGPDSTKSFAESSSFALTMIYVGDLEDRIVLPLIRSKFPSGETLLEFDWPEGACLPEELSETVISRKFPYHLVLHRRGLGPTEITMLNQLRDSVTRSRIEPVVELIVGDLVRYADLQVAAALVDKIVPESIAARLWEARRSDVANPFNSRVSVPIGILSANEALAATLRDIVFELGYEPACLRGWSDPSIPDGSLLIWDVPSLSEHWEVRLRDQSRRRPILALLGFADRSTVDRATQAGAISCLDLPFEIDDLKNVLARFAVSNKKSKVIEPPDRRSITSHREFRDAVRNVRKHTVHPAHSGNSIHIRKNTPAAEVPISDHPTQSNDSAE